MTAEWQHNWKIFVDTLASQLRQGARSEQLTAVFGGKPVRFRGTLREKLIDDLAAVVTIELPEVDLDIGKPGVPSLGDQSVSVAADAIDAWQGIPLGTQLHFTAVVGKARSPFPPVQVQELSTGRTVVMVDLSEGRPVPGK